MKYQEPDQAVHTFNVALLLMYKAVSPVRGDVTLYLALIRFLSRSLAQV